MVAVDQFENNSFKLNRKSYLPSYLHNESIFARKFHVKKISRFCGADFSLNCAAKLI